MNTESIHYKINENSVVSMNSIEQYNIPIENLNQPDNFVIKNLHAESRVRKSIK